MNEKLLSVYVKIQNLLSHDDGQDLVEYALIIALISLVCCAGMRSLASAVNQAFVALGSKFTDNPNL